MDFNTLRGLLTLLVMFTFLGICWWAYSARNKDRFEQDALLPFADDKVDFSASGEEMQ